MQHYFDGTSYAKKSGTPSSCVRIMHQLVYALPTPETPTVHWTDVSKPAGTSSRTVHQQWVLIADSTNPHSTFFSLTAQLGHILVMPKHKRIPSYYKRFGRVMDTNRPRLWLFSVHYRRKVRYNRSQFFCLGIIHLFARNCERDSLGVGTVEDSN
jgi:hypothetical protein